MINIAKKLTDEQYESNFRELTPAFTPSAAVAEANRCLYCYDSPCMTACPTHIDISTFIKKISTGNMKGSARTILSSNWIALTCAKACPVDELCEGACVYHDKGEKPIQIGRLQRFVMDWYIEKGMPKIFTPAPKNGKSVGVIGAGPAGLACSAELALLGFDVVVYEAKDLPGGLATTGIAPYKMHLQDSLNEAKMVQDLGVQIKTGVRIGETLSVGELEKKHDALFIGIGLRTPTKLNIPGEDLPGVVDALIFIEKVTTRKWSTVDVGKNVAVIGAGNTAIDAATESVRLGAEKVYIVYRRSRNEMPAYLFEYELAKKDNVEFCFLTAPNRIIGTGKVESLECIKMELGSADEQGRRRPVPVPDSEFLIHVDMVIKSVGQNIEESFLSSIPQLNLGGGVVAVNEETMQTTHPKYFAGGDCINGGREVVNAAADGKKAAHGIAQWIFSKKITD